MTLGPDDLTMHGDGLVRPECVVAHRSGWLFAPHCAGPGGIAAIAPDGRVHTLAMRTRGPGVPEALFPNGIALEDGGSFLIAHLGQERGGIHRLFPDGRAETVTDAVAGRPLPPANFVAPDSRGRLWITVSTTRVPRALDYRPDAASGFIALHADGETRIVAEGLGYANECLLSADEGTLWVNETFGRRLSAFDVTGDGLANRRTVATFGPGTFPDGLAEMADGSLLVVSIVSNRVLRVRPDGTVETVLEDSDPAHLAEVEAAFAEGRMDRPHLDTVRAHRLRNVSSIALGGPAMRTAYLGCLLGGSVAAFEAPGAGRVLPHHHHDIAPLLAAFGETP